MKTLSIIIPVYNEEKTLARVLDKVCNVHLNIKKEMIIIDDGSKDNSRKIIKDFLKKKRNIKDLSIKFFSKENGGKGSAIRKGIELSLGDIITIQDADLE